jgi:hypothetical protein
VWLGVGIPTLIASASMLLLYLRENRARSRVKRHQKSLKSRGAPWINPAAEGQERGAALGEKYSRSSGIAKCPRHRNGGDTMKKRTSLVNLEKCRAQSERTGRRKLWLNIVYQTAWDRDERIVSGRCGTDVYGYPTLTTRIRALRAD